MGIQMDKDVAVSYGVEYIQTDDPNIVLVDAISIPGDPDENYWEGAPGWQERIAELDRE